MRSSISRLNGWPSVFSLRGYVHLKNLDFVRAENDCTQAINQNWEEAQTYAWRAAARGEQNKWRMTFDDLEIACELAGSQRDQYLSLMDSYSETASDYYREQIKNGNESANLFFERGWIYFRSGKYQKAERDFNHALALDQDHPWASVGLGNTSTRPRGWKKHPRPMQRGDTRRHRLRTGGAEYSSPTQS